MQWNRFAGEIGFAGMSLYDCGWLAAVRLCETWPEDTTPGMISYGVFDQFYQ